MSCQFGLRTVQPPPGLRGSVEGGRDFIVPKCNLIRTRIYILNKFYIVVYIETSLLRRLQAHTLPDATPPIGKIHPFSKMALTLEPLMGF